MSICRRLFFVLLFVFLLPYTVPTWAEDLLVAEHGYVRLMPPGHQVTAGFVELHNNGGEDVVIISIESSIAKTAEMHEHQQHGDMLMMHQVESVTVPAQDQFVFQPGEHHLMLMSLTQPLIEGEEVTVDLIFSDGNRQAVTLLVKNMMSSNGSMDSDMNHSM